MFFFLILCSIVLYPNTPKSFAADYDPIVAELKKDNWRTGLSKTGAMNLNDETIFNAFVNLINNTGLDWRIRIRGITVLGESGNPRTADFLMQTFYNAFVTDECPAIKTSLASELGNFRDDTRVIDALISGLDDSELQVREASIRSLGIIGNTRALPFLIERLNDGNFAVRVSAIRSIGQIGDKKAVPFLKKIADNDGDALLRKEAETALLRIK